MTAWTGARGALTALALSYQLPLLRTSSPTANTRPPTKDHLPPMPNPPTALTTLLPPPPNTRRPPSPIQGHLLHLPRRPPTHSPQPPNLHAAPPNFTTPRMPQSPLHRVCAPPARSRVSVRAPPSSFALSPPPVLLARCHSSSLPTLAVLQPTTTTTTTVLSLPLDSSTPRLSISSRLSHSFTSSILLRAEHHPFTNTNAHAAVRATPSDAAPSLCDNHVESESTAHSTSSPPADRLRAVEQAVDCPYT